ncbi:hypothetical protein KXV92_006843 [Aspergillus fumigatus]|nr:hypothetical protein KXX42_004089 [Aspergillus fumigatus]KAH1541570.1 hypothetical protein KXX57_006340 [Aspergillus fumigatus]KAH1977076.1 hypothetical protein KXW88_008565 [Aspergillus fumigatus]KAH2645046.1 hypothetical protein KXV32_004517 [Aspergillus fumigatus]KAH3003469.1 hypothetical protein KXW60_006163 [Aspergillus fumigatus]
MPLMDRFLVPLPDYWNNWAKKPDAGYTQEPTDISTAVLKDLWRSLLEEQNDEAEAYQSLPQRFGCEKSNRTLRANGCSTILQAGGLLKAIGDGPALKDIPLQIEEVIDDPVEAQSTASGVS